MSEDKIQELIDQLNDVSTLMRTDYRILQEMLEDLRLTNGQLRRDIANYQAQLDDLGVEPDPCFIESVDQRVHELALNIAERIHGTYYDVRADELNDIEDWINSDREEILDGSLTLDELAEEWKAYSKR